MADFAIFLDGEGGATIVTGTTGCSFFHLGHGHHWLLCRTGNKHGGMTFATTEGGSVDLVAEKDFARVIVEKDIFGRMAIAAPLVAFDGEGFGAVVASAARLALFHIGHGENRVFEIGRAHV